MAAYRAVKKVRADRLKAGDLVAVDSLNTEIGEVMREEWVRTVASAKRMSGTARCVVIRFWRGAEEDAVDSDEYVLVEPVE